MRPQDGLFHSPGLHSAVVVWRLKRAGPPHHLREAGAALSTEWAQAGDVHGLLAFEAPLVSPAEAAQVPPLLPRQSASGAWRFPSTQAHVLLQLSAETRERLLWALRRAHAGFAGLLTCEEELLGGRIGDGREPFGFKDPLRAPTEEDVRRAGVVPSGPLAGAAWILYQRFQQDLERFARLRPREQEHVVGRTREGVEVERLRADSHLSRTRVSWDKPTAPTFIRRGFPFRDNGEEGLAFIAASGDPLRFHRSLDALLGVDGGPPDALLRYCEAVGGGLYLAPPRDWFDAQRQALREVS